MITVFSTERKQAEESTEGETEPVFMNNIIENIHETKKLLCLRGFTFRWSWSN